MLKVLAGSPVASPLEACFGEEYEAEIVMVNLVGEIPCAVAIVSRRGGLDEACSIFTVFVIGIVERVDIYSQSACMLR